MPETQEAKKARFMSAHGLPAYDARLLSSSRALADYFEAVVASANDARAAKPAANWLLGEVSASLNHAGLDIAQSPVKPAMLAKLIAMTQSGALSSKMAKDVFAAMWADDEG